MKPILLTLARSGLSATQALEILEAMGITSRRGVPYDAASLRGMLKDRLWGPGGGIPWGGHGAIVSFRDDMMEPIIENLIRYKDSTGRYLSAEKIGALFGRSGHFIRDYIKRKWGFNSITEARRFFDTHYLGYHRYDFYSFN